MHEEENLRKVTDPISQSIKKSASEIENMEKELLITENKILSKKTEKDALEKSIASLKSKISVNLSMLLNANVNIK